MLKNDSNRLLRPRMLRPRNFLFPLLVMLSLLFVFLNYVPRQNAATAHAQPDSPNIDPILDKFVYLPQVERAPVYLTPEFVSTINLPGALCPNDVKVNPVTGIAYVANHESGNVSLLQNGAYLGTVATGEWPTLVSFRPSSSESFVTNLHGGVSHFDGGVVINTIFPSPSFPGEVITYGEPYAAAFNPVNNYLYIVHIGAGGYVQVVDDGQTIANIPILEGWLLDVKVDPVTGLVYVANWEHGKIFVIQDTAVINSFQVGWGVDKLAINQYTRYIYGAHTSPNGQYPNNISITDMNTNQVTPLTTSTASRRVALDKLNNLAYFTNPNENTVSIVQGTAFLGNVAVGQKPWDVGVHQASGLTFVTNFDSANVTVLKNGQFVETLAAGKNPVSVGVDPLSNYVYVANETSTYSCNGLNQCFQVCETPATVTVYRIPTD